MGKLELEGQFKLSDASVREKLAAMVKSMEDGRRDWGDRIAAYLEDGKKYRVSIVVEEVPPLPSEIAAYYEPFESIDAADVIYVADPVFVYLPDLRGILSKVVTAADGSRWRVRRTSPSRPRGEKRGTYTVLYSRA